MIDFTFLYAIKNTPTLLWSVSVKSMSKQSKGVK